MGSNNPWLLVIMIVAGAVVARWWWQDLQVARQGPARGFPGATPASGRAVAIAATGALVLVALETAGESALGLAGQQSRMTGLFGLYTLVAAFMEELVFRGYLVVENRGRAALWAGIVGTSLLFALLHPFLWEWRDGALHPQLNAKGWFSTGAVLAASLWFYAVRVLSMNPTRSLLPCIAAHLAKNLAVIGIKAAQGFIGGWW
ncbi:MAG TPA: CPBP family intramembrane glutamic endopeptidase [Lacunisphaera sp.]